MLLVKNNKGFSLVEMLIASAIGIAVILYLGQYIKVNESVNKKVMSELENTSDNLNMESVLRKDLTGAKFSLNNLNIKDDKGLNFFDYLSNSSCVKSCTRSLKLELDENDKNGQKDRVVTSKATDKIIYFIIADTEAGALQIFNPADAYVRNTLNFESLNYQDNLAVREKTPWGPSIKNKSVLIMVYSPIEVFSQASSTIAPGKNLSFMGWAGKDNYDGKIIRESITDNGFTYYDNRDPRNGRAVTSEDEFFKNMPYTVGLGSFAFLVAVKVIRYRLIAATVNGKITGHLVRGELKPDNTFSERPVGFNIKKVEFSRESISSPAIYIKTESMK